MVLVCPDSFNPSRTTNCVQLSIPFFGIKILTPSHYKPLDSSSSSTAGTGKEGFKDLSTRCLRSNPIDSVHLESESPAWPGSGHFIILSKVNTLSFSLSKLLKLYFVAMKVV